MYLDTTYIATTFRPDRTSNIIYPYKKKKKKLGGGGFVANLGTLPISLGR
jgi:hypothetical protein